MNYQRQLIPHTSEGYPRQTHSPPEFGIWTYLKVLWERKGIITATALLGAIASTIYSLAQEPVYQAKTLVEVHGTNENFLNMREVNAVDLGRQSSMDSYIQTQIELIQNEITIGRVLKRLGESQADLERPGKPILPLRKWLGRDAGTPPPRKVSVERALANLSVRSASPARLIRITYDSTDAEFATRFANSVADEVALVNIESRLAGSKRTNEWLENQVDLVRQNLERAENQMNAYARSAGLRMNADVETVDQQRLRQLQEELSKAQADRLMKQSHVAALDASKPEWLPQVADNATLQNYQLRLAELRRQLAELNALYTPAYYKSRQLQAQINEMESTRQQEIVSVQRRIRNEYEIASNREKMLTAAYGVQDSHVQDQSAKMVHYLALKREVDTSRTFHGALTQRLREANIASSISPTDVRVAIPAGVPGTAYKPQNTLNVALGLFVGLMMGIAAIMVLEQADRRMKRPGDAFDHLQLPELGAIPSANNAVDGRSLVGRGKSLLMLNGDSLPVELTAWHRKPSLMAESFRQTMVSVLSNLAMQPSHRVIVVTSPNAGEGKTMVSSNLSISLAESERKVLIVDGDLRNPRLQQIFGLSPASGLTELLLPGEPITAERVHESIRPTRIPNLFVMTAGSLGDSISPLLQGNRIEGVIKILRQSFDVVLVDSPPALEIADARLLARVADGTILVLRAGQTSIETAATTRQRLFLDGVSILGVVLNDWDPKGSTKYGQPYGVYKRRDS